MGSKIRICVFNVGHKIISIFLHAKQTNEIKFMAIYSVMFTFAV